MSTHGIRNNKASLGMKKIPRRERLLPALRTHTRGTTNLRFLRTYRTLLTPLKAQATTATLPCTLSPTLSPPPHLLHLKQFPAKSLKPNLKPNL
mmetsp:Transcript_55727/g.131288  ORF Transcript_55727/g.131288 Transcript_55727/m.131288 type:complete len:94 (+) Transcript_55727:212-493(+)